MQKAHYLFSLFYKTKKNNNVVDTTNVYKYYLCNFSVNIKLMKELWLSLCSVFFRFDNLKSKFESKVISNLITF